MTSSAHTGLVEHTLALAGYEGQRELIPSYAASETDATGADQVGFGDFLTRSAHASVAITGN